MKKVANIEPIKSFLTEAQWKLLDGKCYERNLKKNESLFLREDRADSLFYLKSGIVQIGVYGSTYMVAESEFIGIEGYYSISKKQPLEARAMTKVEMIIIPRTELEEALRLWDAELTDDHKTYIDQLGNVKSHVSFLENMIRKSNNNIVSTYAQLDTKQRGTTKALIARKYVQEIDKGRFELKGGIKVVKSETRDLLTKLCMCDPSTVNRNHNRMQSEGIMKEINKKMFIMDEEALRKIARGEI